MAQEIYSGEDLPTDVNKKFEGLRASNSGAAIFLAQEGVNVTTVHGKRVANAKVQVGSETGAGASIVTMAADIATLDAAIGGAADLVAGDDTGAHTHISLLKRALLRLLWLNDAVGAITGAAVTTDANGTLQQYARGQIVHWVAFLSRLPAALTGSGNLKTAILEALPSGTNNIGDVDVLSSALPTGAATSALQTTTNTALGAVTDLAIGGDSDGTLKNHIRFVALWAQQRMPGTLGRLSAATSLSTAMSTEDKAVLDAVNTKLAPATTGGFVTAIAVTTTATAIKAANSSRKKLIVKNSETGVDAVIWLGFDGTVTAGKTGKNFGPLYPGESVTLDYTGAIYGITTTGTAYAAPAEMS